MTVCTEMSPERSGDNAMTRTCESVALISRRISSVLSRLWTRRNLPRMPPRAQAGFRYSLSYVPDRPASLRPPRAAKAPVRSACPLPPGGLCRLPPSLPDRPGCNDCRFGVTCGKSRRRRSSGRGGREGEPERWRVKRAEFLSSSRHRRRRHAADQETTRRPKLRAAECRPDPGRRRRAAARRPTARPCR